MPDSTSQGVVRYTSGALATIQADGGVPTADSVDAALARLLDLIPGGPGGPSDPGHNHDGRYYTEAEIDALLAGLGGGGGGGGGKLTWLSTYAKANGTDQSAGVQAAFDHVIGVDGGVLVCDVPGVIQTSSPLFLGDERANSAQRSIGTLMGQLNIEASQPMDQLLTIRGTINTRACEIEAFGNNKAKFSIYGENFGRSSLGHLHGYGALTTGFAVQPGPSPDNNNAFTIDKIRAWGNGTKHVTQGTVSSLVGSAFSTTDDAAAYSIWTLTNPLPAALTLKDWAVNCVLFADGRAMQVRRIVNATTVEIYNENRPVGTVDTLTLASNAINIPYYGDSGIFGIGHVDVRQNPNAWSGNIGGYGGVISSWNQQANFGGLTILKRVDGLSIPHFYTEQVPDWTIIRDGAGTDLFIGPGTNADPEDMQIMSQSWMTLTGRNKIPESWMVFKKGKSPLQISGLDPADPPRTPSGTVDLIPGGATQAYHRASGSFLLRIDNNKTNAVGRVILEAPLTGDGLTVTVSLLSGGPGHTVMGGTTFTFRVHGTMAFSYYLKEGTTAWRFAPDGGDDTVAAITGIPSRLGQRAAVAGVGYMATGTASAADWKQVTN